MSRQKRTCILQCYSNKFVYYFYGRGIIISYDIKTCVIVSLFARVTWRFTKFSERRVAEIAPLKFDVYRLFRVYRCGCTHASRGNEWRRWSPSDALIPTTYRRQQSIKTRAFLRNFDLHIIETRIFIFCLEIFLLPNFNLKKNIYILWC